MNSHQVRNSLNLSSSWSSPVQHRSHILPYAIQECTYAASYITLTYRSSSILLFFTILSIVTALEAKNLALDFIDSRMQVKAKEAAISCDGSTCQSHQRYKLHEYQHYLYGGVFLYIPSHLDNLHISTFIGLAYTEYCASVTRTIQVVQPCIHLEIQNY